MPVSTLTPAPEPSTLKRNSQAWYRPVLSPEHGVYVMLLVSFLSGAAAAQHWTGATTLALICAFCGFQAEHPWMLQIKQRKSFKPRFWLWGGLYSLGAAAIALYLYRLQGDWRSPLGVIYLGAFAAFVIDALAVYQRQQKAVVNELVTFAAVCLAAPLAYEVTTGTLVPIALGLWLLNTLFFASAIFTVKLRKPKTQSWVPGAVFHAIATLLVVGLWAVQGLPGGTALAFGVALLKFGLILWRRQWYGSAQIQAVAALETGAAVLFLGGVALSVLPTHLPG